MPDTEKATAIWEIYGILEIYGRFRSDLKINPKVERKQFPSREALEEWKSNNPDFWIIAETEEE